MPYAANGRISQQHFKGSIEISEQQYKLGLEAMVEGKEVNTDNGFAIVDPSHSGPHEPEPNPDPTYADELATLNRTFQSNVDALGRAHLVAALANGSGQATKQAAIAAQYKTLQAKYVADVAALRAQYGA